MYAPCGLNGCNTYDCKNRDGSGVGCLDVCSGEPTCACEKNHHRASPGAPCTPLVCRKPVILPHPWIPSLSKCKLFSSAEYLKSAEI